MCRYIVKDSHVDLGLFLGVPSMWISGLSDRPDKPFAVCGNRLPILFMWCTTSSSVS